MQMRMRTTEMVPWNRSLLVLWLFQSLLLVLVLPGPMLHPYPSSMSETVVQAFCPPQQQQRGRPLASVRAAAADALEPDAEGAKNAMQWELFQRHHAVAPNNRIRSSSSSTAAPSTSAANTKTASWKGIWTTYDLMGDAILETVASVDYQHQQPQAQQQQQPSIAVSHTIVTGTSSTLSDCETCFDSDVMETTTIPVATYTPSTLEPSRVRLGACGMIVGPSLMRSSGSST